MPFLTLEDLQAFGSAQVINLILWMCRVLLTEVEIVDGPMTCQPPFLYRLLRCSQWTLWTSPSSTTPPYLSTSPTTTLSSFIYRTATSTPYCESTLINTCHHKSEELSIIICQTALGSFESTFFHALPVQSKPLISTFGDSELEFFW